jgi:hypothetical protein
MRDNPRNGRIPALVLLAIAVTAVSNASAQEPLRWKFDVGQKLNYNMVQDMTIGSAGGPLGAQNVSMRQEMDMTWEVQGVNDDGEAVIQQKFERVKMNMTLPVGVIEYDSKSEAAPVGAAAMLAPMYKTLTEAEFELTMTARGEIKDVKIPDEVLAALKNSPGAAAMGDMATPEGFKKMISQGALVLPESAPKPGDSWSTKVEMNNPTGGKQVIETTYRYEGTKDVDDVTFAVFRPSLKMSFEGTDQAKIKEQNSSGEVLFNVEAGRLHSSKLEQKVSIEQALGIQTKIDQTIAVTVTPAEAAGAQSTEN